MALLGIDVGGTFSGGTPGLPGRSLLNGSEVAAKLRLAPARDRVSLETPGGGGDGPSGEVRAR